MFSAPSDRPSHLAVLFGLSGPSVAAAAASAAHQSHQRVGSASPADTGSPFTPPVGLRPRCVHLLRMVSCAAAQLAGAVSGAGAATAERCCTRRRAGGLSMSSTVSVPPSWPSASFAKPSSIELSGPVPLDLIAAVGQMQLFRARCAVEQV